VRWAFFTALVVVAGAVAAFAIYTFGWREREPSAAEERERALAFAQVACSCTEPDDFERVAPGLWRGREGSKCFLIDVNDAELTRGMLTQGGAPVPCE
jgi:hypothetical protein